MSLALTVGHKFRLKRTLVTLKMRSRPPKGDRIIALPQGPTCVSLIILDLIDFLEFCPQDDTDANADSDAANVNSHTNFSLYNVYRCIIVMTEKTTS